MRIGATLTDLLLLVASIYLLAHGFWVIPLIFGYLLYQRAVHRNNLIAYHKRKQNGS